MCVFVTGGFIDCVDDDGNYLRKPSAVDLTEAFKLSPFYSDLSFGMRCITYHIFCIYLYSYTIHTYTVDDHVGPTASVPIHTGSVCLTSTFNQIAVLSERALLVKYKDPSPPLGDVFRLLHTYILQCTQSCMYVCARHVVVSLFYGSLFYQLSGGVDPTAYSERLGVLFFTIIFMVMGKSSYVCMYVCSYLYV